MRCLEPHVTGEAAFPCGKCPSCVADRRRVWTHRIMLEAMEWPRNAFGTLTYAEDRLPWQLEKDHLTLFLKRLRERSKFLIRYYAVGEYSPLMRPHFHLALFNYPTCSYLGPKRGDCPCPACSAVREAWGFGHIMLGSLEQKSAQYIAGYVLKKMNSQRLASLGTRQPEFARMSLRPGIGAHATWDVASTLMNYPSFLKRQGDVPSSLRHSIRKLPLGPYLKRLTRKRIGLDEKAPESAVAIAREPLRLLFDFAKQNAPPSVRRQVVKAYIGEWNEQLNRNVAARSMRRETV